MRDPMECPIDESDVIPALQIPALQQLEDFAFLEVLKRKKVSLRLVKGELRVSAPAGIVHQELLEELRRRKSNLFQILAGRIQRRVPFRPSLSSTLTSDTASSAGQSPETHPRDRQLTYWLSRLAGASTHFDLPFSYTRPPVPSAQTDSTSFVFPLEASQALREFAKAENCSLTTALLAVFTVLLFRDTERDDFCIGARVSVARSETSSKWINTVIVRCRLTAHLTFREWIRSLSSQVSEAIENGTVPYEVLSVQLKPATEPGIAPIAQILFDVDVADDTEDSLEGKTSGIATDQRELNEAMPAMDLAFSARLNSDATMTGTFIFRREVYGQNEIRSFADTFGALLRACALEEDRSIGELSILSTAQQQQMLVDWNRTELQPSDMSDLSDLRSIHRLFERQAVTTPDATAIAHGRNRISYRTLNLQANRLAHLLLQHGVCLEEPVGICMTRSPAMIVAMVGILKAGGCYLPLDPTHPTERLDSVLTESKTRIVVSERAIVHSIALHVEEFLAIDDLADELAALPISNPEVEVSARNLAYIIYTSGSTGRPKGVAIEHHSTVSLLQWAKRSFTAHELSRVLASTSICFDLSVFEVFVPLSWGHTTVLVNDLLDFAQNQDTSAVSLINTVPSVLSTVLATKRLEGQVACVNLAGEPLPVSLVQRIERDLPATRICDLYGPTETTTYSTMAIRRGDRPATIGRPIGNTTIFIVDSRMQPVPPNIPGQLLIGGEGVARGYLYQTAMTAERFVVLDHLPGAGRLYRTGDLARYTQDGTIEYLGRIDRQVKLRGFRIELGEIESVLRRNEAVLEAVVLLREENKTLTAYVVPRKAQPGIAELVGFQRAFLPPYMVVTDIVLLEKLPLTSNGKMDSTALLSMTISKQDQDDSEPAAITSTERDLLAIWERHFKRVSLRVDDDFFALGGHSLLAYQIFADIEKKFRSPLMLSVLFKAPTVHLLAMEIDRERAAAE